MLLAVGGAAGFVFRDQLAEWLALPDKIALASRLEARWRALDVTRRALTGRPKPTDWSGAIFLGRDSVNQVLQQLEGYRLEFTGSDPRLSGVRLEVQTVDFRPSVGFAEAQMAVVATKGDASLHLRLLTEVSVQRVEASGTPSTFPQMVVRLVPVELEPAVRWRNMRLAFANEWSRILPALGITLAKPDLFDVAIPFEDTMRLQLGLDRTDTTVVNRENGSTVSYRIIMPATLIEQRLSVSVPVFRPEGLWLLGRLDANGQTPLTPGPTPSSDALAGAIDALQADVESLTRLFEGNPAQIRVSVGRATFDGLGERLAQLPDASRVVTIQSTARHGQLARAEWKNALIGDGGYYAELQGNESAQARIQIGRPHTAWDAQGLHLEVPAAVDGKADIHFHFDPLMGGGAGTTAGIEGKGQGTIRASTKIELLQAKPASAAIARFVFACEAIQAQALTDGNLKVDMGWIKVPQVGARFTVPIGGDLLSPVSLLDNKPMLVVMPASDRKTEPDAPDAPWAQRPKHKAFRVAFTPTAAVMDDAGFVADATVEIQPLEIGERPEDLETARRAIDDERAVLTRTLAVALEAQRSGSAQTCPDRSEMAIVLGPVEIGPQNEIVKWVTQAGIELAKATNELKKLVESAASLATTVVTTVTPKVVEKEHQYEVKPVPGVQINVPKVKLTPFDD